MTPKESLARNLRYLMDQHQLSEAAVARRAGVSQRTVNNMLRQATSPSLDNVEMVAQSFGLNLWHLIMPDLPTDLIGSKSLAKLYHSFCRADPELRTLIMGLASRANVPG